MMINSDRLPFFCFTDISRNRAQCDTISIAAQKKRRRLECRRFAKVVFHFSLFPPTREKLTTVRSRNLITRENKCKSSNEARVFLENDFPLGSKSELLRKLRSPRERLGRLQRAPMQRPPYCREHVSNSKMTFF